MKLSIIRKPLSIVAVTVVAVLVLVPNAAAATGGAPKSFGVMPSVQGVGSQATIAPNSTIMDVDLGLNVKQVEFSPDGDFIYAMGSIDLFKVEADTGAEVNWTDVGPFASSFVVSNDGSHIYFGSPYGYIDSVNTSTWDRQGSRTIGITPGMLQISPDDTTLFVGNTEGYEILAVDADSGSILEGHLSSSAPWDLALSPDGTSLYSAFGSSGVVRRFDTTALTLIDFYVLDIASHRLKISEDGSTLFVLDTVASRVEVVDLVQGESAAVHSLEIGVSDLVIAPDGERFYVSNLYEPYIYVHDANTGERLGEIPLASPGRDLAISPDGTQIAVTHGSSRISILGYVEPPAVATPAVVAQDSKASVSWQAPTGVTVQEYTVHVHQGATEVATWKAAGHSTGRTIPQLQNGVEYRFSVSYTVAGTTSAESTLSAGVTPDRPDHYPNATTRIIDAAPSGHLSVSADGSRVYALLPGEPSLYVIDAAAGAVIDEEVFGHNLTSSAVSPDGRRLYLALEGVDEMWVIDTATLDVEHTVHLGFNPVAVDVTPDGSKFVAAGFPDSQIVVVDTQSFSVLADIETTAYSTSVNISTDGAYAYAASQLVEQVVVVDLNTFGHAVFSGPRSFGSELSPDGTVLYLAKLADWSLEGLSTSNFDQLSSRALAFEPTMVRLSADGSVVYLTSYLQKTVYIFEATQLDLIAAVDLDTGPFGLVMSPAGDRMFVATEGGVAVLEYVAPDTTVASIEVTAAATAVEGQPFSLTVEGFNAAGDSLGDVTNDVTLQVSGQGSATSGSVTFGFDPTAMGGSSSRTVTATLTSDPSVTATSTVLVSSTATGLVLQAPTTANQGDTITVTARAVDGSGNVLGNADSVVTLTSSVPTDVITGNQVRFVNASPHIITATVGHAPSFTAIAAIEVSPTAVGGGSGGSAGGGTGSGNAGSGTGSGTDGSLSNSGFDATGLTLSLACVAFAVVLMLAKRRLS